MKIAVPTIGSLLDDFFYSCEVFTIFTIDDTDKIIDSELLFTPEGCDCKNNIPLIMQQKGVNILLANKMPDHSAGVCTKYGMNIYLNYSGEIHEVVLEFLQKRKKLHV